MYEYLIGMDPKTGAFVPQLATEWSIEPDGKSYRFKLRKGVQLHKGWGEFTAKDVLFTYDTLVHPDSLHGESGFVKGAVEGLQVINDYEVVVNAVAPNMDLLITFASEQQQANLMTSKASFDAVGEYPLGGDEPLAGTGPYQFLERAQGQFVRYERVPGDHWRITADFPELEIRWLDEASTRLASLLTEEIHITNLPEDQRPTALSGGMKLIQGPVPGLRTFLITFCCMFDAPDVAWAADLPVGQSFQQRYPDSPLQDVRVRRALNQAIDRDLLNESFFRGKGEIMARNNYHPTRPAWDPSWEQRFSEAYGYDPQKARELLAEAGYDQNNPFETNMLMVKRTEYGGSEDVQEAIVGFWRDVGVKANIVVMDRAQQSAKSRAWEFDNHYQISATSSHLGLGIRVYDSPQTRIGSPEIPLMNELFVEARTTLELTRQRDLLRQSGEVAYINYIDVPLFWLKAEVLINPKFVSDWEFPGAISGTWSHLELIKAAR
ncbi:MAG: ABC transporter substrate-binding protein [Chloroflexi bacterium]|nr:ABC transporter substrate-binding protein [Chloroflexota bacterium]